ncbi:MAG: substrate-binding domain-containing protein, partial [Longicatena sp.]
RSLNSKGTKLIGVMIGDITNNFANQIVKGIEEFSREHRYQLIVGNSGYNYQNEKDYVNRMLAMGVDGFIIQPSTQFGDLLPQLKGEGKQVVFIDSQVSMNKEKWVKTNSYEAILEACDNLIKKGYNDFLLISADPTVLSTRMERIKGFKDALQLHGKTCKELIVEDDIESKEMTALLNSNLKFGSNTLIFVANCFLLPRVYVALHDYRNLMPHTLGLIGFDNTEWSNLAYPSVSSIVQPAYEEGYQAAKILIDAIEDKHEEAPNQILRCNFNWYESTNLK